MLVVSTVVVRKRFHHPALTANCIARYEKLRCWLFAVLFWRRNRNEFDE